MQGEQARYWRDPALPGLELLRARYQRHTFLPHVHESYALGVIEAGAEGFRYRGAARVAPAGSVVLIAPGEVHTGQAAAAEGWRYRMLYPEPAWIEAASQAVGGGGLPDFAAPVLHDPALATLLLHAHRAMEAGASTLTREGLLGAALTHLVQHHARRKPVGPGPSAVPAAVRDTRALLDADPAANRSLSDLAARVGLSPFHLARRFTASVGLPPHTYQLLARVRLARRLLEGGRSPAEAALEAGFADQAHLTRVFKRVLGVPPGAYRRSLG